MEYFPNYPVREGLTADGWAREKELEGWHGICASDHFWVGATRYPHVFVTATQMACATERIAITTSFCNNLFRSPVEFAQAALALQEAANGRFEAGLGAGWAADEIEAVGWTYPPAAERVSRYIEALKITAQLFETGQCTHQGEHYQIDISGQNRIAHAGNAPPLIGSAGGPRALREITPIVDRIEIKASARATRVGHLDFGIMASVTQAEVLENIDRVRQVREDVPIGIFVLVAAGDNELVRNMKQTMGNGFLGRFMGAPDEVAAALSSLSNIGIDRVQLTELVPGSHANLAPLLLADAAQ